MTSGAAHSTPDDPDPPSDSDSDGSEDDAWGERGILIASILASALLHVGGVGSIHYIARLAIDLGADIEWLTTSDELTGLGHRVRDQFAEIENPPPSGGDDGEQSSSDQSSGPSLNDEQLKKALDGSYEPPDPPEPDPEPTPSSQPKPRAKSSQTPSPPPKPAQEPSDDPKNDDQKSASSGKSDPSPFQNISDHNALDRSGPNNLPDMRSFAPGNARMSALIRVDRIRGKPYAGVVKKILRAVPDYRLLLGNPTIDPVRDMDWFFMASPNPRYIQHTFLAVRHRIGNERLVGLLDERYPNSPPWETYESLPVRDLVPENPHYRDPRRILLAGEGLTLVAKRKLLDQVAGPLSEDSELLTSGGDRPDPRGGDSTSSSGGERPTLIDGLMRLHRVARREHTIVLMSARGLAFSMPGVGRLPRFESVRLAVTRPDHPTLDIDLQFKNARRAAEFERQCPAIRTAVDDAIPFSGAMGLSSLLEELDCKADEAYVNVHGEYTVEEVANLGELIYPFVPRPPALSALPEPPEKPKDDTKKDAGTEEGERDAGNKDK